jgi:hypothetical protein
MTSHIGLDRNLLVAMYGSEDAWSGVSGSGAGPALACPARLALPAARTTTEAAERGTELHEFARACTVHPAGRSQALLNMTEKYRHTAEGMNLGEALHGLNILGCERAYALNVKTRECRFIGEDIDRDYNGALERQGKPPLSRYEIPFSIDVEAVTEDGIPVELDYKSGQSIGVISEHWQRRICASGLMFHYETATAISRVAYIWDDGSIHPDGHEFSVLDAEDFCDEQVRSIDAIWKARLLFANGIMPPVSPSDEACQYCPAYMSCPYWTNFAKAMLGRLQDVEKGPELSTLTPEEKAKLWDELKKAEKVLEHTLEALKGMAAVEPFVIDEKYEVRPQSKSRAYFDAAKARGLIVTLMGKQGASEEEIQKQISKLHGKTEYQEVRKLMRHLPMAS